MHNERQSLRRTTQGWHLLVRWHDGTTSWEPLRNLKESNPIKLAEYAMATKLSEETAFHWWVPFTLKKRDRIISASKTWSHKRNQKFGILNYCVEISVMLIYRLKPRKRYIPFVDPNLAMPRGS